jgi:hypothetical protein
MFSHHHHHQSHSLASEDTVIYNIKERDEGFSRIKLGLGLAAEAGLL